MKINITQRHIERGQVSEFVIQGHEYLGKRRTGTPNGCPVAIAINEQIPSCEAIVPGRGVMLRPLLGDGEVVMILFPESARLFVMAFDIFQQCGHVAPQLKPFAFELDIPASCLPAEPKRPTRKPAVEAIYATAESK